MVLKVSPCYIYNIYNSTRSDWLWAPYFLNYFESELFYWDGPFTKSFFRWGTKKMLYIQNWWTIPLKIYLWVYEIYRYFILELVLLNKICRRVCVVICNVYVSFYVTKNNNNWKIGSMQVHIRLVHKIKNVNTRCFANRSSDLF